jgi:hypothetical protein
MREQTTVLYEATNLDTPAAIAGALVQIQEYFGAQPSFPHNILELAPCGVRITETTFERPQEKARNYQTERGGTLRNRMEAVTSGTGHPD